jgi:hypothetical protein
VGDWLFESRFEPRLKPREAVLIAGRYYEVVETRPMLPLDIKLTNITSELYIDLRDYGLKGTRDEVLNYRLRVLGPARVTIRVEGAGGPVFGGWGALERVVDERTPENMLEFVQLSDTSGWLVAKIAPIVVPAWCKLTAYGYVYVVRELARPPVTYMVPPYVRVSPYGGVS